MTNPSPTTLTGLFWQAVDRYPDELAVSDPVRAMTYRALAAAACDLAGKLAEAGAGPEDRVAVCMPRGVSLIAAVLGILEAGAAYLPIDDRYPPARRDFMLRDGAVRAVVTMPSGNPRLQALDCPVIEWEAPAGSPGARRPASPVTVHPETAACVLYTSGTTGEPKGVVLEHRQMVSFALNQALPALRPGDRMAQTASVSFDTFTFEVWRSIAVGAHIVILAATAELMSSDPQRELRRARITALLAPAIVVNEVVRYDREAFSALRLLCSGGDVLLPATCTDLRTGGFTGRFFNLYGPTETTVACSGYEISQLPGGAHTVPIGTAFGDAALYVLDAALSRCPDGVPGELYVGGAGVGRGYLARPGLTARRFVADPFAAGGGRMYATGDRVRRAHDGQLEFIGRMDDQVKIRGHRIEPREVEHSLRCFPEVREAAVLATGEGSEKNLVAFLVPAGEHLSLRDLRHALSRDVPEFMVPAQFIVLEAMPVDAHGKRDWPALAALVRDQALRRAPYAPPRNETEQYLIDMWEELLRTESIGIKDDFFALGGHSLLAVRIRLRVQRELGVHLPAEALFENNVLEDQAMLIDGMRETAMS